MEQTAHRFPQRKRHGKDSVGFVGDVPVPLLKPGVIRLEVEPKIEIKQRLAETIAWCSWRARADDAGWMTRSLALRPTLLTRPFDGNLILRIQESEAELHDATEFICERWREELERLRIPVASPDESVGGGRIMCTNFDTDQCAAAISVSNGFFDEDDIPGWDTWFYHRSTGDLVGEVYCWIPPVLIDLVDKGMLAIPVSSAWWVEALPEGVV